MRRGRRVYQPDARYCRLYVSSVTPRGALRAQAVLSARTRTRFLPRRLRRLMPTRPARPGRMYRHRSSCRLQKRLSPWSEYRLQAEAIQGLQPRSHTPFF